jgi:hypothetical protein
MAKGDLDFGLLVNIMKAIGESRGGRSPIFPISTGELMDLVSPEVGTGPAALDHLDRHVDFLRDDHYLTTGAAGICQSLRLTPKGQKFVQPELAEFGQPAMLPEMVKSVEQQIQILTYPAGEKEGLLFKLREAVARNAPDLIAKIIVEAGARAIRGGT